MKTLVGGACLMLVIAIPRAASAEEKQPEREACRDKAEGDACSFLRHVKTEDGESRQDPTPGACQTDECCDLDYSGGSPPKTVCGECLVCQTGAASNDDGVVPPGKSADAEPPRQSGAQPDPSASGSGCSRTNKQAANDAGQGGALGLFCVVWASRRRGRRRPS